jgi:SAM-dependent methyltransferase
VKAPIDILGLSNGARSGLTGFVRRRGAPAALASRNVTINNLLPGRSTPTGCAARWPPMGQQAGQQPFEAACGRAQAQGQPLPRRSAMAPRRVRRCLRLPLQRARRLHHRAERAARRALDAMVDAGLRCDAVLAVWVLQHCLDPAKELDRIRASLRRGGQFFIVDMHHRAVPTDEGWIDDGFSVRELVDARFECIRREPFAAPGSQQNLLQSGWVGVYRKP